MCPTMTNSDLLLKLFLQLADFRIHRDQFALLRLVRRPTNFALAMLHAGEHPQLADMLTRIQNDLFDLGADLATPDTGEKPEWEPLRIVEAQVERLETEIDLLNGELSPLNSFILPGGSALSAYLHLARTISRRAERLMVALKEKDGEIVSPVALKYVNRVSDFLFVAARYANDKGKADVLWVPGKNR